MISFRFLRAAVLAAAFIAGLAGVSAVAQAAVQVTINGNPVDVNPAPILQAGRVFVPLRSVFENLGASVDYQSGQINATANGTDISLTIGSTQATVNGSPVTVDVAPFIVGDYTYVPLRFISQALGASVSWDDNSQTVEISDSSASDQSGYDNSGYNDQNVSEEPPPIPAYEPPPVPDPNYVWMPGYWAWGYAGYYWVPGTWVQAPQQDLYWTPGYWAYNDGSYGWHAGYWASQVGYYGGINYGGGYYGRNWAGGQWSSNGLRYNTAVVRVSNPRVIHNVYDDRTVISKDTTTSNHVSFNGGPHGVTARPTAQENAVAKLHHVAMTSAQKQHVSVAATDRTLLKSVNGGKPPVVTATHPFTAASKPASYVPLKPQDRIAAPRPAVPRPAAPRPAAVHTSTPPRVVRPQAPRPAAPRPAAVHTSTPPRVVRPQAPRPAPARTVAPRPVERPVAPVHGPVHTLPAHTAAPARPAPAHPAPVRPTARPARPVQRPVEHPAPPRANPVTEQPHKAEPPKEKPSPKPTPG